MKKVVYITGCLGFIGSHLTEMLVSQGYYVKALSQYNSFNNWGWLENVNCMKSIEGYLDDGGNRWENAAEACAMIGSTAD